MSELFRFIQTPEIVDIEKYILQKSGMRDSSQSNNGLHGSITTRKREFQLSSLNVLVTKIQDSGELKTYTCVRDCLIFVGTKIEKSRLKRSSISFASSLLCYCPNSDTLNAIKQSSLTRSPTHFQYLEYCVDRAEGPRHIYVYCSTLPPSLTSVGILTSNFMAFP